jgi:hypothetical protein
MNTQVQYSNKMNVAVSTQRSAKDACWNKEVYSISSRNMTVEGNDDENKLVFTVSK